MAFSSGEGDLCTVIEVQDRTYRNSLPGSVLLGPIFGGWCVVEFHTPLLLEWGSNLTPILKQALCLWQQQNEQSSKKNRSPSQQQQGREVSNDSSLLSPCTSPIITCPAMLPPSPSNKRVATTHPSFAPSYCCSSFFCHVCAPAFLNPHFLPPPTWLL